MKIELCKDQRFSVAKELLVTMLGKIDIQNTLAMINEKNDLICMVRETAIFICNLGNIAPGFPLYIDCESTFSAIEDKVIEDNISFVPIKDIRKINSMNEYYNRYVVFKYPLIFHRDNMELDEEFSSYLSAKSSEGAKFYKGISLENNKKFMFPVFSGFPKLLKNDTISLNIYSMSNTHYMIEMNIFKIKLKREIKLIYRVLNVF